MKKIFSIIVVYNPDKEELLAHIRRLKEQTNFIVICNNSDYNVEFNKSFIKVFNFAENLGIAKAQNVGMEWAFSNGADFVLQVDQDSIPNHDMVEKLLKAYDELTLKGYNIGLIGPQDFDKVTKELNRARLEKGKKIENTNCVIVKHTLSSGSLIPKETYDKIGGMCEKLFIDAVDFEYCWRINSEGYKIIKVNDALLGHRLGVGKKKILKFIYVSIPSPIRHYYQFRNILLLLNKSYAPLYWKLSNISKLFFKLFVYPIVFDDGKLRLKYMKLGIKDAFKKKYGRIDGKV